MFHPAAFLDIFRLRTGERCCSPARQIRQSSCERKSDIHEDYADRTVLATAELLEVRPVTCQAGAEVRDPCTARCYLGASCGEWDERVGKGGMARGELVSRTDQTTLGRVLRHKTLGRRRAD